MHTSPSFLCLLLLSLFVPAIFTASIVPPSSGKHVSHSKRLTQLTPLQSYLNTCRSTYSTVTPDSGDAELQCGVKHVGYDLKRKPFTANLQECLNACARHSDCQGLSLHLKQGQSLQSDGTEARGHCRLKNYIPSRTSSGPGRKFEDWVSFTVGHVISQ